MHRSSEVILSGGDPLSLATPKLAELTDALATIAHIRRLRIHTRLPIVLPERVDDEFIGWLRRAAVRAVSSSCMRIIANEIDATVARRMRRASPTPARPC